MSPQQIFKVVRNFEANNPISTLMEMDDFIFVLNKLTHSLYEGKVAIKPWQAHLEILLIKLSQHAGTMVDAIRGNNRRTHIRETRMLYPDLASTYVLARAVLETYFVTYYLNFDSKNDIQNNFRIMLYEMSGLYRRQEFGINPQIGGKQLEDEKKQIEELKRQISSNAYFMKFDSKRQNALLSGKYALELSTEDIIKSMGVLNPQLYTLWKLYSNFAHSEYIGALQLNQYFRDKPSTDKTMNSMANEMIMIMALQIDDLTKYFPSANIVLNALDNSIFQNVKVRIDFAKKHFFTPLK